ncbi:DNA-binding transcriptional LysR family regulator [Rhodoligotrophos appendicifer]|uniref:LysR substrate-binding domain-containing protein n=1 Tax=Rhodoligotrophos appendicifer TaxID=987056 RepID=UPI0011869212|nr:LysR substrate-binding domain-containing protein [Rhodoligotrophos appendicifer]
MKIRQLEAFQEVITAGSVTRAAERLGVSQPAVSQLLGQLERGCGFKLFERRGSKIIPTREAEALYTEVQRMFVGVGRIARVAAALRDQSWGSVKIAAFPTVARRIVPEIVQAFAADREDVRFHLESMRSQSLIDAVAAQNVDIGLSVLPGDRPEVESTLLYRMRTVCIVPRKHRLAEAGVVHARDLAGEAFISLGPQDHSRTIIDRVFDELRVPREIRIETGQSETTCSFVAANAGIAIVDPICVYNIDRPDFAVLRFEPAVQFDVWLIRPRATRSFNLVDSFSHYLEASLLDELVKADAFGVG